MRARPHRDILWPLPALLLLLLACFGRLVLQPSALLVDGDRPSLDHARRVEDAPTLGNDATRLFLPHHAAIAGNLARLGRVPTWDDRGFGGRPLVGNPQAGLFYPPTWLAWRFWTPRLLGWITAAHLLWAGLGTYGLARSMGMGSWGAIVAGGCFQACPYVLAQAFEGHYPHVWSASWMPWAFLAMSRARRGDRRWGLKLVPILALAALAGHPQEAYYLILALVLWFIHDLTGDAIAGRWGEALRRAGFGVGIAALVVGFTAVEWLPDALVAPWTLRASVYSVEQASRYHLFPINAVQLLCPFALGRPGDYFGHDNYWEALTSIGLIPLTLILVAVWRASDRRVVRGCLTLLLIALVVAAGRQLGLFTLLYRILPGMGQFRVPARTLFLANLGAALLAGLGADSLRRLADHSSDWQTWNRWTVRVLLALGLLVVVGGWAHDRGFFATAASSRVSDFARIPHALAQIRKQPIFWFSGIGILLGCLLSRIMPDRRPAIAVAWGALSLAELGAYGHALLVVAPQAQFLGADPISQAIEAARLPDASPVTIRAVDAFYDDLRAGSHGFLKTNINDSFQIRHAAIHYETLYRTFKPDPFDLGRPMDAAAAEHRRSIRQQVLDQRGVQFLVADRTDLDPRWPVIATGSWANKTYSVCRNPTAFPHVYWTSDQAFLPDRSIGPIDSTPHLGADRQTFLVTTSQPGRLNVNETWMPGWTARVDGRLTPVRRGDHDQCAIALPVQGHHKIALTYAPPGLKTGSWITAISVLSWLALGWNSRRQPRDLAINLGM